LKTLGGNRDNAKAGNIGEDLQGGGNKAGEKKFIASKKGKGRGFVGYTENKEATEGALMALKKKGIFLHLTRKEGLGGKTGDQP